MHPSYNLPSLFYNIQEDNIHVDIKSIPIHLQVLFRLTILHMLLTLILYIHDHIMLMHQEFNNKLVIIINHSINNYRFYFFYYWCDIVHIVTKEKIIILVVYQHIL